MCRVVHVEKLTINTILRIFDLAIQYCLDTTTKKKGELIN